MTSTAVRCLSRPQGVNVRCLSAICRRNSQVMQCYGVKVVQLYSYRARRFGSTVVVVFMIFIFS